MSKTSSQKEAKKRRKERAKELRDLGRQATSKLSEAEMKVESSEVTKNLLRKELDGLRSEYGRVTTELAEVKRENVSLAVLLDGLRVELTEADSIVRSLETEKADFVSRVATLERELAAAKAADSDARSLRSRLATKSRETDDLRGKLNLAQAEVARLKREQPRVWGAKSTEPAVVDTGKAG